jgi:tetratricopeptide (TPR) repeat protein
VAAGLDPGWAEPAVLRGWTYWHRAAFSAGGQREDLYREALEQAAAALAIRPGSAAAHELRGATYYRLALTFLEHPSSAQWLADAERELRTAVAADRSLASAWSTLSSVLRIRGQFAEANRAAQVALEEDAYLADANEIIQLLYRTSLNLGRDYEASRWCRQGRREFPADWRFLECELSLLAWVESAAPDPGAAWQLFGQLEQIDPPAKARTVGRPYSTAFRRMLVASVLARGQLVDSSRAVMERTRSQLPDDAGIRLDFAYDEACLRQLLGETDRALLLLADYLAGRPELKPFVAQDPRLRTLSGDPRFMELVAGT